ncbi:MAG: L-serine ammonia-lyase, iron-sulfur-dependent, subunit alpha [Bacteroidetes bacterium]|nr:L-serine ammonia-lyase, iron-sulfur-dependent, subunit alpha [Bacteroidota bacterium]
MSTFPSIFNDVIGPVMRGPSSSHCAAALRIGRLCRDLMGGRIRNVLVEFDPDGSLATTHKSQGSDMGLFGGLLGWEAYDERLPDSASFLEAAGIRIEIVIAPIGFDHPNTYKLTLDDGDTVHTLTAISTGGGMIEVLRIDGTEVSMAGDYHVTLVYTSAPLTGYVDRILQPEEIIVREGGIPFLEVRTRNAISDASFDELLALEGVTAVQRLAPVLPVLSSKDTAIPFLTCKEMLAWGEKPLWELAVDYECARGGISRGEVFEKMRDIVRIMRGSIRKGLEGTKYEDRLLGSQSVVFKERMDNRQLVEGDILNRIILYVSAIMEVKSSMGVIVAAPTAGSCGALPGAVMAVAEGLGLSEDKMVEAMLAAGLIGVFISAHATFAAEVGGCQAECGSGACMAAAAIVWLAGGSLAQSLSAASLALQNSLGMICDPIANRVEAPCLGKNVLAASNALSCANMALASYDHLIPLDEVIAAMDAVGHSIPNTLRCTNLGGLSITPTAKQLEEKLETRTFFKSC